MLLDQLLASFHSLPPLPIRKLGPAGADSLVGGFVYILGPVGLSKKLSCEAGSFSCHLNPHRFFQSEVLRLYFPRAGTLGCAVCLTPQLFLPVYLHANVAPPTPPATASPSPPAATLL